jgi:magnesium-transporting ATPase (P-type)
VARARGPSRSEAARQLAADGRNVLPSAKRPASWRLLIRQVTHLFAILLWAAAGPAFIAGMPQLAVAIVAVILINGGFAFIQEYRADRAADRLRGLMPSVARVLRDDWWSTVDSSELVAGDVVALEAGDRVCADLRPRSR